MKRGIYVILLVLGLAMTAATFVKMCNCITYPKTLLCDVIAMLGGGIFCSTVVSWIFDKQNRAKEERIREEQRKFILASARNRFIGLLREELREISTYYAKYLTKNKVETICEEVSLPQMGEKLVWLLTEIEISEEDEREADCHTITPESIKQGDEKKTRVVMSNKLYYKGLHQTLLELSTYYNTCLISGVMTEQQIEILKQLTWEVNDIVMSDSGFGFDDELILAYKRLLFEKVSQYFPVLDISENDKVTAHFKNVFAFGEGKNLL